MAGEKAVEKSEKSELEVVRSDGRMSEQAQPSFVQTLPSSSDIFGAEGFNPFNFQGREISMTAENLEIMLGLFLEENKRREKLRETYGGEKESRGGRKRKKKGNRGDKQGGRTSKF
ncbi:hypothetical protein Csa_010186 [Cucumis sativus]|uniref:Uncharacterized protein n=1 Tax=Cucumis sativus TaxID=3659 RepID=A0A0A0LAT2_CUCSA|nr:hypothetical protein Csa_010186 [Cucumis sativus]